MKITAVERKALQEALIRACRAKNPNPKIRRSQHEWPTLNALAVILAGEPPAKKEPPVIKGTVLHLFHAYNPTANPGEPLLNALARYAGYGGGFVEFQAATQEAPTRDLNGDAWADRLRQSYRILQELRQARQVPDDLRNLLVYNRTGNDDFIKAYVDVAYLNGYYGQLLAAYMVRIEPAGHTDDVIFAAGLLYLRAFLVGDSAAAGAHWLTIQQHRPRAGTPAFAHGRWAFAALTATPAAHRPTVLEELGRVHPQPSNIAASRDLPASYNYFPAGFHFLVCEALFLLGEYLPLAEWVARTRQQLEQVQYQPPHNVYYELLDVFGAVALLGTGQPKAARTAFADLTPSLDVPANRWLWDYYQVYWWLADLQFAVAGISSSKQEALQNKIAFFAKECQMPFFSHVARTIISRR